jgi:hypothetical protein
LALNFAVQYAACTAMEPIQKTDSSFAALQLANPQFRISQPAGINLHAPARSFRDLNMPVAHLQYRGI